MVYAGWQRTEESSQPLNSPVLIDPAILKVARQVYRDYCETHSSNAKRPSGVVVNQLTYQGKVLFSNQPILLPQERFIPVAQLESENS